jgi:hypothetical protein
MDCSHCNKGKASQFLEAPGGAHIPLCGNCVRKVKSEMAKARVKLRKSGMLGNIDPKIKDWLRSPKLTTSSDQYDKQEKLNPSS